MNILDSGHHQCSYIWFGGLKSKLKTLWTKLQKYAPVLDNILLDTNSNFLKKRSEMIRYLSEIMISIRSPKSSAPKLSAGRSGSGQIWDLDPE